MTSTWLKDAARRRAARHGCSYQRALQALTRYDTARTGEAPRTPAGVDWTPLHGLEVSFANDTHQLRGVVLPPDGVRPGADILRVAITHPAPRGLNPAEVTYLDARRWTITPMPADADNRHLPSKKRTRGPRGVPLYRYGELPATAVATRTMLRDQYRYRPAPDQAPVAELLIRNDYYDLYAIDDAVPMRALPPARQAAWTAARTCARCRAQSPRPYEKLRDGHHYCPPCYRTTADTWWDTRLEAMQAAAIDWARALVADPRAVLINITNSPVTRVIITDIATRTTLHDHTVWWSHRYNEDPDEMDWLPADQRLAARDALHPATLGELLRPLRDRRIIAWPNTTRGGLYRMAGSLPELDLPDPWSTPAALNCDRWYGYWLRQLAHPLQTPHPWTWAPDCHHTLALRGRVPLPSPEQTWTAEHAHLAVQAHADLQQLHRMAAGAPGPVDIEANQPPVGFSHHVYVSPEDLDQYLPARFAEPGAPQPV